MGYLFDPDNWKWLFSGNNFWFLLRGFWINIQIAFVAMVLSLTIGLVLALLRVSTRRVMSRVAGLWVAVWRNLPLIFTILYFFLVMPESWRDAYERWVPEWFPTAFQTPFFLAAVIGLTLYNSAVLAEIMRAGIVSLERGQGEAAASIGLRHWQAMRLVVLPQGLRRMVPATVSQLIALDQGHHARQHHRDPGGDAARPDRGLHERQPVRFRRRRAAPPGVPHGRDHVRDREPRGSRGCRGDWRSGNVGGQASRSRRWRGSRIELHGRRGGGSHPNSLTEGPLARVPRMGVLGVGRPRDSPRARMRVVRSRSGLVRDTRCRGKARHPTGRYPQHVRWQNAHPVRLCSPAGSPMAPVGEQPTRSCPVRSARCRCAASTTAGWIDGWRPSPTWIA